MKRLLALFAVASLALAGCGTLFTPAVKNVPLSSNPQEAEVYVDGVLHGETPLTLELSNRESHTIEFRKDGHGSVVCQLNARVNKGILVLDLFGFVPLIVDAATGGWRTLDEDSCTVSLPQE